MTDTKPNYTGPALMVLKVDGRKFEFRPAAITAKVSRRVRQDAGMSIQKALTLLDSDPDIDILATILFAAAVQTDPKTADIDEIDEMVSYGSDVSLEFPEDDAPDPEG